MPSLEPYSRDLPYSYAPGFFPSLEALKKRPQSVRRLLLHSKTAPGAALDEVMALCRAGGIRTETADRMLTRISGKENCFVAAVFDKEMPGMQPARRHLVLHHPADKGNLGTILRTALGLDFRDLAIIGPAADHLDPHVVRASMGALFSLNISVYDSFLAYRAAFPDQGLHPFMLEGAVGLREATRALELPYALVFGNEGAGLPDDFAALGQAVRIPQSAAIDSYNLAVAAAIGMYAFRSAEG
ncbi:MAG: TrmH family RNA methyltransferase [Christensenellales bacterium]